MAHSNQRKTKHDGGRPARSGQESQAGRRRDCRLDDAMQCFVVVNKHPGRYYFHSSSQQQQQQHADTDKEIQQWNVSEALSVLDLTGQVPPPPSKRQIQQSFTRQAKLYHPDSKFHKDDSHNNNSNSNSNGNVNGKYATSGPPPQSQRPCPCPVKFRHACEARDYLLRHYHDGPFAQAHYRQDLHRSSSSSSSGGGSGRSSNGRSAGGWSGQYQQHQRRKFAQGFPTQTLRVLTLKQNLALRGTVATGILLLVGYDVFVLRRR